MNLKKYLSNIDWELSGRQAEGCQDGRIILPRTPTIMPELITGNFKNRSIESIHREIAYLEEKFIKLLRQFDLTNLEVAVATDGTILPNSDLKTLLESCKRVSYKVSLDGVGEVNNWIRWPSKFSIIENNINTLEQWWADTNINLQFHTVIGIYNINHLQNLVDFILKKPQWNVTWNWITTPTWQSISVLINKEELKIQLQELGSKYDLDPNPFYISIDRLYDSPQSDWPTAVKETKRLILERNILPKSFSAD